MGTIIVSQNMSLDGVVEDPTSDEGGTRHAGWFDRHMGDDRAAWAQLEFEEALGAAALLWGRRSHEFFARRWADRSDDWANRLRELPKYIVSTSLTEPQWDNSTVLAGDVVHEVSRLKQQIEGEIVVYASRLLVGTLIDNDLVDELRLIVFPIVLGDGERLFDETDDEVPLRLLTSRTVGQGLVTLHYEVRRDHAD
jgi:dihydrofolate reductase